MKEFSTVENENMLEALFGNQEGSDGEFGALVQFLKSLPPEQIVRWYGPDGDKTAAQMIEHLNRKDEVGQWYLNQVKIQGWRPPQLPTPESQAYEAQEATFGRVIHPVDRVMDKKIFFVTKTGKVYKEKSYEWEKPAEVDFSGQKIELVEVGNIDPEDIRKQIRRFVYGQIGDVAPYNVNTETGETWDDFVMFI